MPSVSPAYSAAGPTGLPQPRSCCATAPPPRRHGPGNPSVRACWQRHKGPVISCDLRKRRSPAGVGGQGSYVPRQDSLALRRFKRGLGGPAGWCWRHAIRGGRVPRRRRPRSSAVRDGPAGAYLPRQPARSAYCRAGLTDLPAGARYASHVATTALGSGLDRGPSAVVDAEMRRTLLARSGSAGSAVPYSRHREFVVRWLPRWRRSR
jgi:hypothetical protein